MRAVHHLLATLLCMGALLLLGGCSDDPTSTDDCELACDQGLCVLSDDGDALCECDEGYEGDLCEDIIEEESNPCDEDPCQNDGICEADGDDGFTCECTESFSGDLCEIVAEVPGACDEEPCQNDGICVEGDNDGFTCECTESFSGDLCEIVAEVPNPCDENPCQNEGLCVEGDDNGFTCECTESFSGDLCEDIINQCDAEPCQNGATCVADGTDFTCECVDNWTSGELCECDIAPVSTYPGELEGSKNDVLIGFAFTPQEDLVVTQLGAVEFDGTYVDFSNGVQEQLQATGLEEPMPIGLYDDTGLIASATVQPDDPLSDGFRWRSIIPVQLTADTTYTLVALVDGDNGFSFNNGDPITYDEAIISEGLRGNSGNITELPDTAPGNPQSWDDIYYGASLTFEDCP